MGMSQEEITEQVENTDDMTDLSEEYNHLYVSKSVLDGNGFFSFNKILSGEKIAPARIGGLRTNAGRYCNHAFFANAEIIVNDNGSDLFAIRDIEEDEEITVNYRQVLNNRLIEGDLCQE